MRTTDLLLALPSGHPHSHTRPQTGSPRRSPCSWTTEPGGSASGWGSAGLSPTNTRQSVQYISICYKTIVKLVAYLFRNKVYQKKGKTTGHMCMLIPNTVIFILNFMSKKF